MNSATYKRPFKQVSSHASLEGAGKNGMITYGMSTGGPQAGYTTTGSSQYAAAGQADGPSGGPMSTTSNNMLNPGESTSAFTTTTTTTAAASSCCCCCCCCQVQFLWLGFGAGWSRLRAGWRNFSLIGCWHRLINWLSSCCSVGELGPSTALELDSLDLAAAASASAASESSSSGDGIQQRQPVSSNQRPLPVGL